MTDEEVQKGFGREKSLLEARFRIATQKALANAGLLKTTDLVLLQAFCLYIVGHYYLLLDYGIMLIIFRSLVVQYTIDG